jgi:threonine aldolase
VHRALSRKARKSAEEAVHKYVSQDPPEFVKWTESRERLATRAAALLTDDLWLRSARHANAMARRLESAVRGIPGVRGTQPVEANAVFAILPAAAIAAAQEAFFFYVWDERRSEVRWMASWDTTEEDVDQFAAAIARAAGSPR